MCFLGVNRPFSCDGWVVPTLIVGGPDAHWQSLQHADVSENYCFLGKMPCRYSSQARPFSYIVLYCQDELQVQYTIDAVKCLQNVHFTVSITTCAVMRIHLYLIVAQRLAFHSPRLIIALQGRLIVRFVLNTLAEMGP